MEQGIDNVISVSLEEAMAMCADEVDHLFRLNSSALLSQYLESDNDTERENTFNDGMGISTFGISFDRAAAPTVPGGHVSDQLYRPINLYDKDMKLLKYYSYGIVLPTICILGIIGNILNLIVLTRPTMRGPAYVYMRGYAMAALLAIFFALPFSGRILFHNEIGPFNSFAQAFFHAHLELFLGNACLGIGVFMLVALTIERYLAVCRLGRSRCFPAHKTSLVAFCLALLAISLYLPYLFRAHVITCQSSKHGISYQKKENPSFAQSTLWAVYLWTLEVIFKMGPTIIIAHLNCCIIVVYRRTCARRRQMVTKGPVVTSQMLAPPSANTSHNGTSGYSPTVVNREGTVTIVPQSSQNSSNSHHSTESTSNARSNIVQQQEIRQEDSRRYWEEKRLMFLLGSTSVLFFVCITPQLVLSLLIKEEFLQSYPFQVFRAIANVLEVANYSLTFYIYCLFSRDFRSTLFQTLRISSRTGSGSAQACL